MSKKKMKEASKPPEDDDGAVARAKDLINSFRSKREMEEEIRSALSYLRHVVERQEKS